VKHYVMSHCEGDKYFPRELRKSVDSAIDANKGKPGRGQTAPIRRDILGKLKADGWSGEVQVSIGSVMTITSMRENVALCLQTGNVARCHSDLLKLQTMYLNGGIKAAALIVPSQEAAKKFNSNVISDKRLERELVIFKKVYHVPTLVFVLEG
jgi:hypothetical protein